MPSKCCGRVEFLLKFVDMHTQATIELDAAEQSVKRLDTLMQRSDTAAEVIGALIDVADMVVKIIDNVAKVSPMLLGENFREFRSFQIHPVIKVAWQITSSMYKVCPCTSLIIFLLIKPHRPRLGSFMPIHNWSNWCARCRTHISSTTRPET